MALLVENDDGFREAFNMFGAPPPPPPPPRPPLPPPTPHSHPRPCAALAADQDNDGFVSQTELKKMMIKMGNALTDEEVRDIMRESNAQDDRISYTAFCK